MEAKPRLSDPDVLENPWNDEVTHEVQRRSKDHNLYFGIMENDGIVKPHPPILRAMRIVREALEAKGYQVVSSANSLNLISNYTITDCYLAAAISRRVRPAPRKLLQLPPRSMSGTVDSD